MHQIEISGREDGYNSVASLPALLDRLQLRLHRTRQLLHDHPPHQEKPPHFLRHSSCPCPNQHCGHCGDNSLYLIPLVSKKCIPLALTSYPKLFPLLSSILFNGWIYDLLINLYSFYFIVSLKLTFSVYCHRVFWSLWTPTAIYAVLKFSLMWMTTLVSCCFISLSITRMFLIFMVSSLFLIWYDE